MNKLLLLVIGISLTGLMACSNEQQEAPHKLSKEQRIKEALDYNFEITKDPALGYPPLERLHAAIQVARQRQQTYFTQGRSRGKITEARWLDRGPNNVGGRTRSILIDKNDPTGNTVMVGGVAGGLWKTGDISADPVEWRNIDDYLENLAIGSVGQDPTDPNIIYAGTGEGFPNADAVRGIGIFKSTDSGESWELLQSTVGSVYDYTRALVVDASGFVYAGTSSGGVMRSEDGGETWTRVLGSGLGATSNSIYDVFLVEGSFYASTNVGIYQSLSGDRGSWFNISRSTAGFPTGWTRTEFSVCKLDPLIIYAVGSQGGAGTIVYRTANGGASWSPVQSINGGGDFTNGQAWYDLDIGVDPFDCNHVIVGGVPIFRTTNSGQSWNRFANNMHVDQQKIHFDPEIPGRVLMGNDGGIWQSMNGSAQTVENKNNGYLTSQFYGCAIHPDTFSSYFLGGTQDNGSLQLNDNQISSARNVWGGDGFQCHIDQNEPSIQLVSSQFGNWGISRNGGGSFNAGASTAGNFLNASDYDNDENILYTQTNNSGDFYRWNLNTNEQGPIDIQGRNIAVRAVLADPNVANRVYFGSSGGEVLVVEDANVGAAVTAESLLSGTGGSISDISIEHGNPDHLIVTLSNYGLNNNIYESTDGGKNWTGVEGDLPDMPVRSVLFNPNDSRQAIIATEAGVWSTELLQGDNTLWIPPAPDKGIPIVRTDQLQMRTSDFMVLGATHGRGLHTTDVFAPSKVRLIFDQVHYTESNVSFIGEFSLNADSYLWTLGDGTTATTANTEKFYSDPGIYPISLTINGDQTSSADLKILEDIAVPYIEGVANYGGSFESQPAQYGVHTLSGSGFELGNSEVVGKDGTRSGEKAYVIAPEDLFYEPASHSILYLANFDMTEENIYTFSFWAKYDMDPGADGFLVEYSTDKGRNWQVLGTTSDPKWYTFNNNNFDGSAFPPGTSYFTSVVGGWTNFTYNVSFLAGNEVAFRFVFRSNNSGNHRGLAIDEAVVDAYDGVLQTQLFNLEGRFSGDKDIELTWTTRPEYFCKKFEIQRSENGRDFEVLDEVNAKGGLTAKVTSYTNETSGGRNLYFYRVKVISENEATGYSDEFLSDVIVVRRKFEGTEVFSLFPNPFTDAINVSFTDKVGQNVRFELFDTQGRLLLDRTIDVEGVFVRVDAIQLPAGIYYLNLQIGEEEAQVYTLLRAE